jgi:hypothetical protein
MQQRRRSPSLGDCGIPPLVRLSEQKESDDQVCSITSADGRTATDRRFVPTNDGEMRMESSATARLARPGKPAVDEFSDAFFAGFNNSMHAIALTACG